MINLLRNSKGIGVIIAVFASSITIITILSTVYIYIVKIGQHQGLIKEVYQGTQVMEEFAKVIRDAYDNYISNSMITGTFTPVTTCSSTSAAPVSIGRLKLCGPTTDLEVEHLGKKYYIPIGDLEVTMRENGSQKYVHLKIYSKDQKHHKQQFFVNWHKRLNAFFDKKIYENVAHLDTNFNFEPTGEGALKQWINFALAQSPSLPHPSLDPTDFNNKKINATPPTCPLPTDSNYSSRDPLCVDCDQSGCIELAYCLYGYSNSTTANPPCDSTTGEGYVKQYIKIICDNIDTNC